MLRKRLSCGRPKNLIVAVVATAFAVMVVLHLPSFIGYTQLRAEIDRRYNDLDWAKKAVIDHAVAGDLSGLAGLDRQAGETVKFSPTSGVITVAFADLPTGPDQTLKLLPIVWQQGVFYPLATFMEGQRVVKPGMVQWSCSSVLNRSRNYYILYNRGTFATELAPADCR